MMLRVRPLPRCRERLTVRVGIISALLVVLAACSREPREREMRLYSDSYTFTIVADITPPPAREPILYKVVVRDRKTRQPIENGEGQIYANNEERASTWDGFEKAPEIGTYRGRLNFVTAGLWAVAIRFRRDSLHRLETIEWLQEVMNERQAPVP
jgi:hypothetical protein